MQSLFASFCGFENEIKKQKKQNIYLLLISMETMFQSFSYKIKLEDLQTNNQVEKYYKCIIYHKNAFLQQRNNYNWNSIKLFK